MYNIISNSITYYESLTLRDGQSHVHVRKTVLYVSAVSNYGLYYITYIHIPGIPLAD